MSICISQPRAKLAGSRQWRGSTKLMRRPRERMIRAHASGAQSGADAFSTNLAGCTSLAAALGAATSAIIATAKHAKVHFNIALSTSLNAMAATSVTPSATMWRPRKADRSRRHTLDGER